MRQLLIYALITSGLFYFSEGKPCPEKTRPHKTRCDAFYKCRELPSSSHVWVPVRCNEGLVYEASLGSCVLPGEDWECITPNEMSSTQAPSKPDADILIVNDLDEAGMLLSDSSHKDDGTVEIVLDSTLSSEEEELAASGKSKMHSEEDHSSSSHQFDSSGDGELVELDSPALASTKVPLKPENREEEDDQETSPSLEHRSEVEKLKAELKQAAGVSELSKPGSPIDPNLTAHLQRLSQLIDGLQQTYQKTEKPQAEMRPDQLNAFLAHFDIKNRYEMMNPLEQTTPSTTTSTTQMPATTPKLPEPHLNKTRLQEHLSHHGLEPETKLMLTNSVPYSAHGSNGQGYANSQIVVNRPEGSVMFALPPNYGMSQEQGAYSNHHPTQSHEYSDHEPKISEDTLKTVLELSKQMIAAQNLPKVLPNPGYNGYYQPILQPVFMSPQGNPFQQYYGMPAPLSGHYMQHKKHSSSGSSPSNGGYNKPSTTIIHNNVIPVHLSSTSSGEKEVLDSYGNSLGVYPSMDKHQSSSSGMEYMTTARPVSMTTMASTYASYGSQSPFANDYTLTTPRPFEHQPSAATVANFYTPSPHLDEHNANRVYQPTESYPSSMNMPRPMDMFPGQIEADRVAIRPNSQKIESMEMMGDDDLIKASYQSASSSGAGGGGNGNTLPHVLTYSSDMSQQLAPGSGYLEQSYQSHHKHQQHPYMPRPTMGSSIYSDAEGNMEMSMFTSSPNLNPFTAEKLKYPNAGSGSSSHNGQLVNFNGNFISLDVFQKSILPLMTKTSAGLSDLGNVEVITCQPGVRQPNQTDCTRYFVCSKKDGKVLSYSCPPYTGFNKQTRICDAPTYAQCGNVMPAFNGYTIDTNRRLQMETIKMLNEAKRRQEAALKAQSIANLLQQYGSSSSSSNNFQLQQQAGRPGISANIESDPMDSYAVNLPDIQMATTTTRPPTIIQANIGGGFGSNIGSSSSSSSTPAKKRKYYCKEGDKIPDQTSISSYFVCYKNAQGQMKGHKMSCSKGLLFCPKTLLCTLATKCTD
ncbi:hypothetical protein KR200_007913 [Drosophila serrata]|nr:hypothetical protein KR200_007913 [Drosophila serrata]